VPESEPIQLTGRVAAAAAAAFLGTACWRFLTFTGFTNDHYAHLALAQQWLLGERPVRDFTDPGWPLTYMLSAAAWRIAGDAMWVEWALTTSALGIAAACTLLAAHRLSRSLLIAALVTGIEIAIFPRSYSYPKLLAYAVAAWMWIAVAARPSRLRMSLLAAVVASAFLLRHDHGLYIGLGSAVCVAIIRLRDASREPSWRIPLRPAVGGIVGLTATTAAFLLPWLLFVSLNGGLLNYFDTALEFARGEANASNLRTWPRLTRVPGEPLIGLAPADRPLVQIEWTVDTDAAIRRSLEARYGLEFVRQSDDGAVFYRVADLSAANLEALGDDPHVAGTTGLGRVARPAWREWLARLSPLRLAPALHSPENADTWLFWLFWSLPFLAVAVLIGAARRRAERWRGEWAVVAALVVVGILVNAGFLRDVLRTRFSDAIVPPALLGSWLLGLCWTARPTALSGHRAVQAVSLVILLITGAAVSHVADAGERLALTGVADGVSGVMARSRSVGTLLASRHRQAVAPPSRQAAALTPFFEYLDRCTSTTERIVVTGEFPDLVVLAGRPFASDGVVFGAWYSSARHQDRTLAKLEDRPPLFVLLMDARAFRSRFPPIAAFVDERYERMTEVPVEGTEPVPILVLRSRVPAGIDTKTSWPCFAG